MPSVRVKRSRQFYTLSGNAPETPVPPPARPRSQSVAEIFTGPPLLSSPIGLNVATQGRRARSNTYNPSPGSPILSRVSQHINNTGPGTWSSRDTPLLQHQIPDFSDTERNGSPLRYQRSTSFAANAGHGHVDEAVNSADGAQEEHEDHDEAVVDHLDVIGKCLLGFLSILLTSLS